MTFTEIKRMIQGRMNRETVYSSVEFWDGKAESYQGDAISMWANPHLNELYDKEQKKVLTQFVAQLKAGSSILDLGCGMGRISRFLAGLGFELTGVDFSEPTIDIAQKMTDGDNPHFICASYHDLPCDEKYDALISIASLTFVQNVKELSSVVNKLRTVLNSNGTFILIEPIHRGFLHRVCNLNLSEFTRVFEQNGFEIQRVIELHFWPARLLLSYFQVPRTITNIIYWFGQLLLHGLFRNLSMGDYKAILAVRKD